MKNMLQSVLLSAALLAVPFNTYADYHDTNIENAEGNLGFGRYFWQLADGTASGGYEDHYYLADVPNEDGTVPNNHKKGVNALTKWDTANGTAKEIETFLHMPAGQASVQLAVATSGPVTFQFVVTTADQKTVISDQTVKATSGEQMLTALDNAQLPASAYYRVRIKVISGHENITKITHWHFDTASDEKAYHPDYLSSPSVHTNEWKTTYTGAPTGNSYDWAYEEVMIPAESDIVGTYAMSLGVFHGYMGIQVNGNNSHDIIFSMWDNGSTDKDPNLPDYLRSGSLDGNNGVNLSRFGGEGTGAKAFRSGNYWEAGQWVKFLVNARPELVTVTKDDGTEITYTNTLVTAWYKTDGGADNTKNAEEGESENDGWRYIATHRLSGGNTYMNGWYSFLENYNWPTGNLKRTAYYRNGSLHSLGSGEWIHRNVVSCSHTDGGSAAGKRNDYGSGIATVDGEPAFYMTTGGLADDPFVANQTMPLKPDYVPVTKEVMDKLLGRVDKAIQTFETKTMREKIEDSRMVLSGLKVVGYDSMADNEGDTNIPSAIVDGDESTFWHTKWKTGTGGTELPHYIDVELPEDMMTLNVEMLKLAENRPQNNRRAKKVQVFCSNAATYPGAAENGWTDCGTYDNLPDANYATITLNKAITGQRFIRLKFIEAYNTQYISLNELYLVSGYSRDNLNAQVEELLDKSNHFDGYPEEELAEVRSIYNDGQWSDSQRSALTEAVLNVPATGHLIKYGTLGEINSISSFKGYYLHNVNGFGDAVYDKSAAKLSLVESSNENFASKADVTLPENNWLILRSDMWGAHFLYNLGAKKFLKVGNPSVLVDEPTPIVISKVTGGFTFRSDVSDNNGFLCAAPQQTNAPVAKWTASDNGSVWEIRDNYGYTPDETFVRNLLASTDGAAELFNLSNEVKAILATPAGYVGGAKDDAAKQTLSVAYNNGHPEDIDVLRTVKEQVVLNFSTTAQYLVKSVNGWNEGYMTLENEGLYHRTIKTADNNAREVQHWTFEQNDDKLFMHCGDYYVTWKDGKPAVTNDKSDAKAVTLVNQGSGRFNIKVESGNCIDVNAQPLTGWGDGDNSRWYFIYDGETVEPDPDPAPETQYFTYKIRSKQKGTYAYINSAAVKDGVTILGLDNSATTFTFEGTFEDGYKMSATTDSGKQYVYAVDGGKDADSNVGLTADAEAATVWQFKYVNSNGGRDNYNIVPKGKGLSWNARGTVEGVATIGHWYSGNNDGSLWQVEAVSNENISITYNYEGSFGPVSETYNLPKGSFFPKTLPYGVTGETPTGAATESSTRTVPYTVAADYPLALVADVEDVEMFYTLKIRNTKNIGINDEGGFNVTADAEPATFGFIGTPWGIKIYVCDTYSFVGGEAGEGKDVTVGYDDDVAPAAVYLLEKNTNGYAFRVKGSTNGYLNNYGGNGSARLAYWYNDSAQNDPGSTFIITEVEIDDPDFEYEYSAGDLVYIINEAIKGSRTLEDVLDVIDKILKRKK